MTALGPVAQSLENADQPKTKVSDWSLYDLQRWCGGILSKNRMSNGLPAQAEILFKAEDFRALYAIEQYLAQFESMRADQNNRSRGRR